MKPGKGLVLLFFYFVFLSITAQENNNRFIIKWDNGFKLRSVDEAFRLRFGGRIMIDHALFWQNNQLNSAYGELPSSSGTEIRRARLFFSGTVYKNVEFKLDVAFEGGKIAMRDVFLGFRNIPVVGNIRVGNVKEPIRLEILTSSNYITFLERSFLGDFAPIRNSGLLIFNEVCKNRIAYQAGIFRNADDSGNDLFAGSGYVFTGRLTGLIRNTDHEQLHLGVSYSHRKPETKNYSISSGSEMQLIPFKYISTGTIESVNAVNLINLETALLINSFSAQAEYLISQVNTRATNFNFKALYGQLSYFITGERKVFRSSYSGFARIKPKRNFETKSGPGAWELALRYSFSDLNSKYIAGGEETDITLGLNWYLNPVTRIMFNYVWQDVKNIGNASAFGIRFQIDF